MTFTKTLIAATAASLLAGAANAADGDKQFDGLYGGIEAGVDWTKLAGEAKRDRSLYYGGVLGFRSQMDNNMVLGLEGTFGDSGYKNNAQNLKLGYEWSASLTLGQAFGRDGANLVYAKAGYVETRVKEIDGEDVSSKLDGWRFGGGYERALTDNMSLRLGADYTTYGDETSGWQTKAGLLLKF